MKRLLACLLVLGLGCGGDDSSTEDLSQPPPDLRMVRCDLACPVGEICINGACICDGTTRCGKACIDLTSDDANCGACGKACAMTELCANSLCTLSCPLGQIGCNNKCTDLMTDHDNCGSCGAACTVSQSCTGGRCR